MLPDFQELMKEWIKKEPKKRQPLVFYPSQLGVKCIRRLFYEQFMEKDVEDSTMMVFEAGHTIHNWVEDFLRWCSEKKQFGMELIQMEKPFTYMIREGKIEMEIHGRIDSVLNIGGKKYVWESKSIKSFWKRKVDGFEEYPLPLESHVEQIHPYMRSERCDKAIIFYVEKPTFRLKWVVVTYNPTIMKKLEDKIKAVTNFALANKLPERLPEYPNYWECDYCPFRDECDRDFIPNVKLDGWI